MPVDFSKRTIVVDGTKIDVDTKTELMILDLSDDMTKVASQMAWWASVRAAAVREQAIVDAKYRSWRAVKTAGLDPKMAEWKAKAAVEADPQFMYHKGEIARTLESVDLASGMFDAYSKKGNILQSRGAMEREERGKTGMTTPSTPRPAAKPAARPAPASPTPVASPTKPIAVPHKDKL